MTLPEGENEAVATELPEVVICRPNGTMWLLIGLSLLIGPGCCVVPFLIRHDQTIQNPLALCIVAIIFGVLFLFLALFGLLFQFRCRVIAERQQLHSVGVLRRRSVYWEEVRDYYEIKTGKFGVLSTVETDAGKIGLGSEGWTHIEEFRAVVQQRATRARAKAWGMRDSRPEDTWPRLFVYDPVQNRRALWVWGAATTLLLLTPVLMTASKAGNIHSGSDWLWNLLAFGMMQTLLVLYCALPLAVVRAHRDGLRRQNERITVDRDGLTFEDGTQRIKAAWEEILGWKKTPLGQSWSRDSSYIVETEAGNFQFTRCLRDAPLLCEIITAQTGRKLELMEGKDAFDAAPDLSADIHRYTYRNRTNRAMLLLMTAFGVFSLVPLILPFFIEQDRPLTWDSWLFLILLAVIMWAYTLYEWANYRTARIETDPQGITQWTLFGNRRLGWSEVEAFALHPQSMVGYGEVVGAGGRVRFRLTIAYLEELKTEIQQRAIHSVNREWEKSEAAKSRFLRQNESREP